MLRQHDFINLKTTCGLEAEFESVAAGAFNGFNAMPHDIHDDGSTRGPTYVLEGDIAVIPQRTKRNQAILCSGIMPAHNFGMEFVTRADTLDSVLSTSGKMLAAHLKHIKKTPRTSIHIHIDVADTPWTYIRDVILWAHHLEAVLFRIAAGGRHHRGELNDYRYTRPLSNPIGAKWGRSTKQQGMLLWNDFCTATTMSDMLAAWGRMDQFQRSVPHYIGHRLHMVNLASVLRQGTLEWRLFDALYEHIQLFVEVVASVHVLGAYGPPPVDVPAMILGSAPNISVAEISELLSVNVKPAWGYRWQSAPETPFIDPHYDGGATLRYNKEDLVTHRNDNGTLTCPLYIRS